MLLNQDFYELTQDFQGALFQGAMAFHPNGAPTPPTNPVFQLRRGYAESPAWFLIQAQEFDPEPLSVERIRVRAVWSSERIVSALLDLMSSEKWFDRIGDDYHLTDEGHSVIQGMTERRQATLAPLITQLSKAEVEPLEGLMRRVLEASLTSDEPPGKWCLAHSRRCTPRDDAPDVFKLFEYCADFNAYRDDSHMAAFQSLGVEAYVWEAFSYAWRETANSPQAIFEALAHRGYSRTEYANGLRGLAERGWANSADGEHYHVTEEGRAVREKAEQMTDEYFYRAWSSFLDSEVEDLYDRMNKLKTKLESIGK